MLIDAVLYNGEEDLLEFRLRLLWSRVDKFVVVESNHTFSGKPKEFSSFGRFSWAAEKLLVSSLYMKPDSNPWINEANQRNAIVDACNNFGNHDILMVGDVDEIPSHAAVDFRRANDLLYPMACDQRIVPYSLDYVRDDNGWRGTVMCDLGYARGQTAQGVRDMRQRYSPFPNGGWHLTYFGGAKMIKRKLESYSHQENNTPEIMERIEECVKIGGKLLPEEKETKIIHVDQSFYPEYFINLAPNHWWRKQ